MSARNITSLQSLEEAVQAGIARMLEAETHEDAVCEMAATLLAVTGVDLCNESISTMERVAGVLVAHMRKKASIAVISGGAK